MARKQEDNSKGDICYFAKFGFRIIWRIMEISEGVVTLLDLHNSS